MFLIDAKSQLFFLIFIFFSLLQCVPFKRNLHESKIHTVKLHGNSQIGYYYLNIFVGSSLQRQTLVIDTGSWVTSFPCTTCKTNECGNHMDDPFNISNSKTAKKISCAAKIENYQCEACSQWNNYCSFNINYSEGSSIHGYFVEDIVIMGDELMGLIQANKTEHPIALSYIENEKANFVFGCTTKETYFIKSQEADGVLGLGINSNTTNRIPNLIDYTFGSHRQDKLEFSLCLSNKDGGFLSIGGYNTIQHISNITFIVPISRESKQYNIKVHNLKIDGEDMDLKLVDFEAGQGTFLDTGTTLFFAHSKIYKKIMDKFDSFCKNPDNCKGRKSSSKCYYWNKVNYSDFNSFLETFPILEFAMDNNFTFVWQPQDYFYSDDGLVYCLPFEELEGRVILGAIFMRNYDILFDRTDREIHFTRANCTRNWGNTFFNLNTSILFDEPQKEKIPINLDSNRAFEVINEINIYDENNNNNENCTPTPEKNITKDVEKNTNQTIENEENIKDQNFSNSPKKIENDNITIDPEQKNNNSSIFLLNQNNQDGNYSKNDTIQIFCKENSEREEKLIQIVIAFSIVGLVMIFGLIVYVYIKLRDYKLKQHQFEKVPSQSNNSHNQEMKNCSVIEMKDSESKEIYSIEDPK